jgi:hypothetical protein
LTVTVLFLWGALSDERTGLSFVYAAGSCQRSLSWFRVPWDSQVKVKVTLRLTVSQSVSLGVEPHLGLMTRYLLLFDSYGLVFLWGALSDERTGLSFVRVIACISKSFVIM